MPKNIVITILALLCLGLLVSNQQSRNRFENSELTPAQYGGLIALREILSHEEYESVVVPFLQEALADGKLTNAELRELNRRVQALGDKTLAAATKPRPQDMLSKSINEALAAANSLGGELGRSMSTILEDLSQRLDEALDALPRREPPAQPPAQL